MNAKTILLGFITVLLLTGCASKTRTIRVEVPPRVNLAAYPLVGLVTFSSNARGELDRLSTERFLQALQAAQPGTRVIELGPEAQVLASVNRQAWDPTTLQAIKDAHGVDVILVGRLEVERVKPEFQISTLVKKLSVRQDVNTAISVKLMETATGATMWSDAGKLTATVSHASFNSRGEGTFGASDPESAYGEMVDGLVCQVTEDLQPRYVLRRVPKNEVLASTD